MLRGLLTIAAVVLFLAVVYIITGFDLVQWVAVHIEPYLPFIGN
jgi:hypothetical protein